MEPTLQIVDDGIHAYTFDPYGISVIAFPGNFEIIYNPAPTVSIREAGRKFNYRFVINGSFFEWNGKHAGWLSSLGNKLAPYKRDRQLTHIASLNTLTNTMTFHSAETWDSSLSDKANLEFQTGPLVLQDNILDASSINRSINGLSPHQRTLLGYIKEDHTKFFITVRKPERLDTLGEHLLKLSIFEGKTLSVINLDGGPSVALAAMQHPELNHNAQAVLPILFAVR